MKANLAGGPRTAITSLAVLARAAFVQPTEPLKLLPTPTGDDANNVSRTSGTFSSLAREAHLLPGAGATRGGSATKTVRLLPTPTAVDYKASRNYREDGTKFSEARHDGMTLTDAIRLGEPTSLPSDSGNTSPGPLPHQLTIGDD